MQTPSIYIIFFLLFCSNVQGQVDTTNAAWLELKESTNEAHREYFDSIAIKLDIPPIKGSTDSFSLRLWEYTMFGYSLSTILQHNNILTSYKYVMWSGHNPKQQQISSKVSLSAVLDSLRIFMFNDIPNQIEISNMEYTVDDGVTYILEIATKTKYYYWRYENPGYYYEKYPANKSFYQIIQFLTRYFDSK